MEILSLQASNFKSFDETGIKYFPKKGLNLIVGENNTGKSNLFQIYQIFSYYMKGNTGYRNQTFKGNELEVKLELQLKLDRNEIEFIMKKLNVIKFKDYQKFSNKFELLTLKLNSFEQDIQIHIDNLHILRYPDANQNVHNYYLSKHDKIESHDLTLHNWSSIIQNANPNDNIEELIAQKDQTPANTQNLTQINVVMIDTNFRDILKELFEKKIIVFPEYRYRPNNSLGDETIATTGEKLSSFLYNLKNGKISMQRLYEEIQKEFTELFPNLSFEVKKESPYLYFFHNNDDFEIDNASVGAGIIETLLILTHLIYYKESIFIIDEPEIHLHPHAIRNISKVLLRSSNKNQIICSTHSPNFIDIKETETITIIKKQGYKSILNLINCKDFSKYERRSIDKFFYNENYKEIFFSRFVVLVEGDTEAGAIPIIASRLNKNFDTHSISVISVGGNIFIEYIKTLILLNIPYIILCDNDVIKNIERNVHDQNKIEDDIKMPSVFKQLSQLKLLKKSDIDAIAECNKSLTITSEEKCNKKKCIKENVNNETYSNEAITKLIKISNNYNFFVLSSDFEGVIKKTDPNIYEEAMKHFPKSKRLQGVYVAQTIENIPSEFNQLIERAYEKINAI